MKIRVVLFGLAACGAICTTPWTACGKIFPKIFETNLGSGAFGDEALAKPGTGTVGVYDGQTGTTFDPALVLGLHGPVGIAISGRDLFVVNHASGTIGKYDAI